MAPEAQGAWLGCGAVLAGVIIGRLAGLAMGISAAMIVIWVGVVVLLWRIDRRH